MCTCMSVRVQKQKCICARMYVRVCECIQPSGRATAPRTIQTTHA